MGMCAAVPNLEPKELVAVWPFQTGFNNLWHNHAEVVAAMRKNGLLSDGSKLKISDFTEVGANRILWLKEGVEVDGEFVVKDEYIAIVPMYLGRENELLIYRPSKSNLRGVNR